MPAPALDGANLSPAQKAQLHEVASLVLDIYRTLADMRFINGSAITTGPHDLAHLQPVFSKARIDPAVAYLYSILPYVDAELAGNKNFFQGGQLINFRIPETVSWGRDPFSFAATAVSKTEEEEDRAGGGERGDHYMRRWMTPLSRYVTVILYDAREHRMWIVDENQWASGDLALQQAPVLDNNGKGIGWDFEATIPSRDASAVLRDINQWYRTLQELPSGSGSSEGWPATTNSDEYGLKALYQKHGWPDRFDGDAFEVDQARAYGAAQARYFSRWPLNELENLQLFLRDGREQAAMHREEISRPEQAKDDEWVARVELMIVEKRQAGLELQLKRAIQETDRLCPGGACQQSADLPLWEAAFVAREADARLHALEHERGRPTEDLPADANSQERGCWLRYPEVSIARARKQTATFEKARAAAQAEAARLRPGETLESATGYLIPGSPGEVREGLQRREIRIKMLQWNIETITEWTTMMPLDVPRARKLVQKVLEQFKASLQREVAIKEREETWLASCGDASGGLVYDK